jgi:leucyl aminopeptidase
VATILHGGGAGGYLPHAAARAVVQGALLGLYNGDEFKTSDRGPADLGEFAIIEVDAAKVAAIEAGARAGQVMAEATNFARTLVNEPANEMTPTRLAAVAAEEADAHGIDFQVIEAEEASRLGMGCYLAVASGSAQPPKFIVLRYSPISEGPLIGLVGKGITFDSGGVSIKPGEGMEKMKSDMAGAAAVLAAVVAAARLKLETRLLAVIPAVENMPGGRAYRPGDVLNALGGKTVEVISTDAEGRLILADALTYTRQQGATHLVDVATLTGGCVIALGHVTTGLFSNDDDLCAAILEAGERAGERLWRLPLFPEYRDQLKSQIADVKNVGGRPAAPITGAIFLEEFVESLPWAHLDIAGTSWNEKEKPYLAEGATGAPTGTLIELLERIARGPRPVR